MLYVNMKMYFVRVCTCVYLVASTRCDNIGHTFLLFKQCSYNHQHTLGNTPSHYHIFKNVFSQFYIYINDCRGTSAFAIIISKSFIMLFQAFKFVSLTLKRA